MVQKKLALGPKQLETRGFLHKVYVIMVKLNQLRYTLCKNLRVSSCLGQRANFFWTTRYLADSSLETVLSLSLSLASLVFITAQGKSKSLSLLRPSWTFLLTNFALFSYKQKHFCNGWSKKI